MAGDLPSGVPDKAISRELLYLESTGNNWGEDRRCLWGNWRHETHWKLVITSRTLVRASLGFWGMLAMGRWHALIAATCCKMAHRGTRKKYSSSALYLQSLTLCHLEKEIFFSIISWTINSIFGAERQYIDNWHTCITRNRTKCPKAKRKIAV